MLYYFGVIVWVVCVNKWPPVRKLWSCHWLAGQPIHFIYGKYRCLDSVSELYSTSGLPLRQTHRKINSLKLLQATANHHLNLHCTNYLRCHPLTHYLPRHINSHSFVEIGTHRCLYCLIFQRTAAEWNFLPNNSVQHSNKLSFQNKIWKEMLQLVRCAC